MSESRFLSTVEFARMSCFTELEKLRDAARKHRDQRGDDRCWLDDEELYKALPEGYEPPSRDSCVELSLCQKYIASRHNPTVQYVSPQRRIEELERELVDANGRIEDLKKRLGRM